MEHVAEWLRRWTLIYPQVLEHTLSQFHLPGENASQYVSAIVIHTMQTFIAPGTHYWDVDRGAVDSKLAQGVDAIPALQELNPRPLDVGSNTITTQPRARLLCP